MASGFKEVNGRLIQGEDDPATGDALVNNLSTFPIGTVYINNNTGKVFVRNAAAGEVGDWVSQSGGSGETPGIDDVLAEGQALSENRAVNLAGHFLRVVDGENVQMNIDAASFTSVYSAYDGIADCGVNAQANSSTNNVRAGLFADVSGLGAGEILIEVDANTGVSTTTHTSGTHTFAEGDIIISGLAGGGTTGLSIDNDGKIIRTP